MSPRRVVIAVDSFKGSLSAAHAARALASGLRDGDPHLDIVQLPIADGGEGTVAALTAAGFESRTVPVSGPLGDPAGGLIASKGDHAVVELAGAAGLHLLDGEPTPLTALRASTFGVGQLIESATAQGARTVTVALGGSCTTDGGAGIAEALGARLLGPAGEDLERGGGALARLARLDLTGLRFDPAVEVVVATDVDNPLLGAHGAVATYGPQKGVDHEAGRLLERALGRWADAAELATGRSARARPGAGAAGGAAFGLVAVLNASIVSGAHAILDLLELERHLDDDTLVIVGEGSMDHQTLRGKAPLVVAQRATAAGARVTAVAGRSELVPADLEGTGIERVRVLSDLEPDAARSMADAASLLRTLGRSIASPDA